MKTVIKRTLKLIPARSQSCLKITKIFSAGFQINKRIFIKNKLAIEIQDCEKKMQQL